LFGTDRKRRRDPLDERPQVAEDVGRKVRFLKRPRDRSVGRVREGDPAKIVPIHERIEHARTKDRETRNAHFDIGKPVGLQRGENPLCEGKPPRLASERAAADVLEPLRTIHERAIEPGEMFLDISV
jgi:hypothetical protein